MFGREMRCLQASDRWCRDLRVELEQVRGQLHYKVFAIPERWREIHRRGLRGETITEDCDCYFLEGEPLWLRWEVRPWGQRGGCRRGF
jgi:hypothetical protein